MQNQTQMVPLLVKQSFGLSFSVQRLVHHAVPGKKLVITSRVRIRRLHRWHSVTLSLKLNRLRN